MPDFGRSERGRVRVGLVHLRLVMVLAGLVAFCGCTSGLTTIARSAPADAESLGIAQGTACGSMVLGGTLTNFIPLGLNSRVERAYEKALKNKPGATTLRGVGLSETWFFWLLGSTRCVTITGEALR